jgi:hypothetical protein
MDMNAMSWRRVLRFSMGPVLCALAIGCVHWLRRGAIDGTDFVPVLGIALVAILIGSVIERRRVRQKNQASRQKSM